MKYPVQLIQHDEGFNCTEEAIRTLGNWLGREVMLMYSTCWCFEYYPDLVNTQKTVKLAPSIHFDVGKSADYNLLRQYHGIDIKLNSDNPEIMVKRIIKELNINRPVILDIDGFWCPWLHTYQKGHVDHGVLLTEWSVETQTFTCVDSFYGQNNVSLTFDQMILGAINCYTYTIKPKSKSLPVEDWIRRMTTSFETSLALNALKCFRQDIEERFDFAYEARGEPVYEKSTFYIRIDRYRRSRKKLATVLEYLSENGGGILLAALVTEAINLFKSWDTMHKLFLKVFLSKRYSTPKDLFLEEITKIINLEELLYNSLVEYASLNQTYK